VCPLAPSATPTRAHRLAEPGHRPAQPWTPWFHYGADPLKQSPDDRDDEHGEQPTTQPGRQKQHDGRGPGSGATQPATRWRARQASQPYFGGDPSTLCGLLEPLLAQDHDALQEAAANGQLWNLSYTHVPRPEQMRSAIQDCLAGQAAGTLVPLTIRLRSTGRIIGMTTFSDIDPDNRRLEIGGTWNARSAQRTGTNTESKLLLLAHAFDQLDCIAVELRTHWLNHQSCRAIERLGAKQDGVLRSHKIMPDGTLRDTVVYSILQHEWPAVRNELRRRLADQAAQNHLPLTVR